MKSGNMSDLCNKNQEPVNNVIMEWAKRLNAILKNTERLEGRFQESLSLIIVEMSCTKF